MPALLPIKSWFKRVKPDGDSFAGQHIAAFFQQRAAQQGYVLSADQQRVIGAFAQRADALTAVPLTTLRSLYLYGAVGRGKSWLLDGFFQAVPLEQKRRIHFHDFFTQLHQGMFRHRDSADAMAATLDELLAGCRLLCFDEFHVHDIGDAMLITRLFKALFARGTLLIVTSNYPPEGLLPNPLYHERFLPVIHLINSAMEVLEVGGATDYRTLAPSGTAQRFTEGQYLWPGTLTQRQAIGLPLSDVGPFELTVGHRQLRVRLCQGRTIGFDFADLCEQPTAVMDYLQLCERFDHWTLDHLPLLEQCSTAAQQRFINLIDVLYDQDKCLTLISQWPLARALDACAIDLMRSRSRLGQLRERHG